MEQEALGSMALFLMMFNVEPFLNGGRGEVLKLDITCFPFGDVQPAYFQKVRISIW